MIDDFHLSVFGSSFIYFVTIIKQEPPKKTQNDQNDMLHNVEITKELGNDQGQRRMNIFSFQKKKRTNSIQKEISDFGYLPTA